MKRCTTILFAALLGFSNNNAYAFATNDSGMYLVVDKTINGTVIDQSTGLPLEGATVSVKGTKTSVVTNKNGQFTITVPNEKANLIIGYIGYNEQVIAVGDNTSLAIKRI
jgi:hypothetical protein